LVSFESMCYSQHLQVLGVLKWEHILLLCWTPFGWSLHLHHPLQEQDSQQFSGQNNSKVRTACPGYSTLPIWMTFLGLVSLIRVECDVSNIMSQCSLFVEHLTLSAWLMGQHHVTCSADLTMETQKGQELG
jgi:hypothetical protein